MQYLSSSPLNLVVQYVHLANANHLLGSARFLVIYFATVLVRTRSFVRKMYKIDGMTCDDVTKSVFCACCTITQLGHYTADYDT